MTQNANWTCAAVRRLGHQLMRKDRESLNVQLFRGSLPDPLPRDPRDIFDLILQIILLLLEEWKPDDNDEPDNGKTKFPKLADQSYELAVSTVETNILRNMAGPLAATINRSIKRLRTDPPVSLRLAREYIRVSNHRTLGTDAHYFSELNVTISEILDKHAEDELLITLDDYLDAWTQIAKGLERIK